MTNSGGQTGGLSKAEVETLVEEGAVTLAPKPSGDETGKKDTENLLEAQPAKGSLVLRSTAPYYATSLPSILPEQGLQCMGMPVVNMVGTGVCFRVHNPEMSTEGGEKEFVKNMPGRFDPFVIDLSKAGSKAVGVQIGDINALVWHGPVVRGGTGAENVGWDFHSEVAWCERLDLSIFAIGNTTNVRFTNGGTATGAFDYSHIEISLQAKLNQHGVVMEKAIGLWGSFVRMSGNCFAGTSNTGVAWKLGADNTAVQLLGTHLEVQLETDGTSGVGHKTIEAGTTAESHTEGVLSFRVGGSVPWVETNITLPTSRFTHAGYIDVDKVLGKHQNGEGLNVLGGSTWSRGFTEVAEAKLKVKVQSGDHLTATLASGVNGLTIENAWPNRARSIRLYLTQPASGEPGTLNIETPGNNANSEAQSVSLGAGGSLRLQAEHGAVDVLDLTTYDGIHWTITPVTNPAGTDAALKLLRPVYGPNLIPSTESVIGTAFRAFFCRCVAPITGVLHDLTVFNGTVVNGNHNVAIFDTGQTTAGKYTPLYETGTVAAAGESKPQVIGSPELHVVAGEQYLLAVMNSGTTHKFGSFPTASHNAWYQLPSSFDPVPGTAFPKLLGQHNYAELKYAAISEAELEVEATPLVGLLGRIV